MDKKSAPHETFELHELLSFKSVCATKSFAMSHLVKDERLKRLMQQDFIISRRHIKELKELLTNDKEVSESHKGEKLQ